MKKIHLSRATLAAYLVALGTVSPSIIQVFGVQKGTIIVGVIGILGALMSVQQPVQGNSTPPVPPTDGGQAVQDVKKAA